MDSWHLHSTPNEMCICKRRLQSSHHLCYRGICTRHTSGLGLRNRIFPNGQIVSGMLCPGWLVLSSRKFQHFTVSELFGLAAVPGPSDLLHANWLRYVKRAIVRAPVLLWQVIFAHQHSHAWLAALQQSLAWFGSQTVIIFLRGLHCPLMMSMLGLCGCSMLLLMTPGRKLLRESSGHYVLRPKLQKLAGELLLPESAALRSGCVCYAMRPCQRKEIWRSTPGMFMDKVFRPVDKCLP